MPDFFSDPRSINLSEMGAPFELSSISKCFTDRIEKLYSMILYVGNIMPESDFYQRLKEQLEYNIGYNQEFNKFEIEYKNKLNHIMKNMHSSIDGQIGIYNAMIEEYKKTNNADNLDYLSFVFKKEN